MALVLPEALQLESSRTEGVGLRAQHMQGRRYVSDTNIGDIYRTLGVGLPQSILLLRPAQSHMVAMASDEEANMQIAEIGLESKDVILVPVNDASCRQAMRVNIGAC